MSNESIERFDLTVLESSVKHVNPDGKMMYVAEHQRIVKELEARASAMAEVAQCAQAVLTALNVGDVQNESPLHRKLREVMIAYRDQLKSLGTKGSE